MIYQNSTFFYRQSSCGCSGCVKHCCSCHNCNVCQCSGQNRSCQTDCRTYGENSHSCRSDACAEANDALAAAFAAGYRAGVLGTGCDGRKDTNAQCGCSQMNAIAAACAEAYYARQYGLNRCNDCG